MTNPGKSRSKKPIVPPVNLSLLHRPLRKTLLQRIARIIDQGRFILGPETQALEQEIARICSVPQAVGLNSGTDALLLGLKALGIGPGDEVIVPDFTFIATASAVLLAGAKPVLADIETATFTLDPQQVEQMLTPRTRAIIPVHLYGHSADMTKLCQLAKKAKLAIIEDAAQALGAAWRGRSAGAWGDVGCFSFFPTKNLGALGDGGMVVTRSTQLAKRLRRLRDHGSEQKYIHQELGYNSRLDEIQAVVLRIKLSKLHAWNTKRQVIAKMYNQALQGLPLVLPGTRKQAKHVYHQYAVRVQDRQALQEHLAKKGIATSVHYPLPLHAQPVLAPYVPSRRRFPVSEQAARQVLCLPIAPELTFKQVQRVIKAVRSYYEEKTW